MRDISGFTSRYFATQTSVMLDDRRYNRLAIEMTYVIGRATFDALLLMLKGHT